MKRLLLVLICLVCMWGQCWSAVQPEESFEQSLMNAPLRTYHKDLETIKGVYQDAIKIFTDEKKIDGFANGIIIMRKKFEQSVNERSARFEKMFFQVLKRNPEPGVIKTVEDLLPLKEDIRNAKGSLGTLYQDKVETEGYSEGRFQLHEVQRQALENYLHERSGEKLEISHENENRAQLSAAYSGMLDAELQRYEKEKAGFNLDDNYLTFAHDVRKYRAQFENTINNINIIFSERLAAILNQNPQSEIVKMAEDLLPIEKDIKADKERLLKLNNDAHNFFSDLDNREYTIQLNALEQYLREQQSKREKESSWAGSFEYKNPQEKLQKRFDKYRQSLLAQIQLNEWLGALGALNLAQGREDYQMRYVMLQSAYENEIAKIYEILEKGSRERKEGSRRPSEAAAVSPEEAFKQTKFQLQSKLSSQFDKRLEELVQNNPDKKSEEYLAGFFELSQLSNAQMRRIDQAVTIKQLEEIEASLLPHVEFKQPRRGRSPERKQSDYERKQSRSRSRSRSRSIPRAARDEHEQLMQAQAVREQAAQEFKQGYRRLVDSGLGGENFDTQEAILLSAYTAALGQYQDLLGGPVQLDENLIALKSQVGQEILRASEQGQPAAERAAAVAHGDLPGGELPLVPPVPVGARGQGGGGFVDPAQQGGAAGRVEPADAAAGGAPVPVAAPQGGGGGQGPNKSLIQRFIGAVRANVGLVALGTAAAIYVLVKMKPGWFRYAR